MLVLTPFYFTFSYMLALILLVSILLRYGKMTAIVSTVEHLVPYESEAYMCLGVILAYVADCILGIKAFSHWGVLSIILALLGVFLIADVKFQIKRFRINLIIRLVCDVGLGYCARFALQYCSNAMYILWHARRQRSCYTDKTHQKPNMDCILCLRHIVFIGRYGAKFIPFIGVMGHYRLRV